MANGTPVADYGPRDGVVDVLLFGASEPQDATPRDWFELGPEAPKPAPTTLLLSHWLVA